MKLYPETLNLLCNLAITAAKEAGELITNYRHSTFEIHIKSSGNSEASQVVTEVDFKSQEIILKHLQPTLKTYDLGLLTEEIPDNNSRLQKDYFWCIDPLDGTLPFTENIPGYGVSIALIAANGTPQIGVVFNPSKNILYHAIINHGVFKNNMPWALPTETLGKSLNFYYNRSITKQPYYKSILTTLEIIAKQIGANDLKINPPYGAVINACEALENIPSCYFGFPKQETGGGSLWDYAAITCIYNEIGAFVSNIHGERLDLNQKDSTYMNKNGFLFYSNKEIGALIQQMYIDLKNH